MKVLWLRPTTGENVSTRRERIAEHLVEQGVDIEICNASGTDAISAIKTTLAGDHDLIIGNVRVGLYLGYFLALILRKPFIADVSDPIDQIEYLPEPLFRFFHWLEWWILRRSEVAFFVESDSYDEANRRGVNSVLARNSVNYDRFSDPDEDIVTRTATLLADAGVSLDDPIAVYAGTLVSGIHLEELIEAATFAPDWQFVFIGEERDIDIEALIENTNNVAFLGSHSHELIPGFLHHATAGLALVNVEHPQKIVEYGAAGLPALAYPGRLKRVFSREQVYFVEPTPREISNTLDQIEQNPAESDRRASNLQDYARNYRWENVAEKYIEQIERLVPDGPR